jgi:osmotically-inducible protein OsmY
MKKHRVLATVALVVLALACASGNQISDDKLSSDVRGAVAGAFSGALPVGLSITVHNGVVTLSGQLRSEEDRRKVVTAVNSVNGVRTLINQMTIAP